MTVDYSGRAHWNALDPAAFGWSGKWDPRNHPDLLVPFTFTTGRGETLNYGKTHRLFAPILREFLTRLDAQAPGVLDSDPDEGSFNDRSKRGGGGRSFHSYGIAADTEWRDNPMGVADPHGPHALPNNTGDICRPLGLQWGGLWKSPHDAMHVETHLSPDDCINLARDLGRDTEPKEFHVNAQDAAQIRAIVKDELHKQAQEGVNVNFLLSNDGKDRHSIEAFLLGIPFYRVWRGRKAKKAK